MFDDSFKLSETYFTTMQLLRMFADTIRQAGPLFDEVIERLAKDEPTERKAELAGHIRNDMKEIYNEAKERLLVRIDEKIKEIDYLRSGVRFCPRRIDPPVKHPAQLNTWHPTPPFHITNFNLT